MKGKFKLGVVFWQDATLYQENAEPEMVQCKTAGWIQVKKDRVIVVSSFSDGKPDLFTVIPKQWTVKIIFVLSAEKKQEEKGQTERVPYTPSPIKKGELGLESQEDHI